MRIALLFLLRSIVSFVLSFIVGAIIGFVISFVGVLGLKIAGFVNTEVYAQKFQYLSMALGFVITIPLYISVFRSQFPKKQRFFAAFKAIAISLPIALVVFGFALFVLEGLIKNLPWIEPVQTIQLYFMFGAAILCFWSGYLTIKLLPDDASRHPIDGIPNTIKLFQYAAYCIMVMTLIMPIVAYQGYKDIVEAFLSGVNPAEAEFIMRQPTVFLSLAFTAAVQMLFIIMICHYRSRFARNLFIALAVFGIITAPIYWYLIKEIEFSAVYLIVVLISYALILASFFLILTPSARTWINHNRNDLVVQAT